MNKRRTTILSNVMYIFINKTANNIKRWKSFVNYAFYNHFLKNRFSFLSLSWCWYVTCYTRLHMFGCISTPFVSNYLELKRNRSWNMRSYVKKYIFVLLDIQHYNWKCTHMCRFISIYDYVSEYKVFNWIKMWMMKPTWPHFIICFTSVYFQ